MTVLIVGSVALDSVETPHGRVDRALGGSAPFASLASKLFAPTALLGVVGADFPAEHIGNLRRWGIDIQGLEIVPDGKTFHWAGRYHENMNDRDTLTTELNVLATHHPDVPEPLSRPDFLFLANTSPELQMKTLSQVERPRLVLADSMNLWIDTAREALWEMIRSVDVFLLNDSEAHSLCETRSLLVAARRLLDEGVGRVIIKKGEHGSLMVTRDSVFCAPAYPLERVCDPTGAGDSFAGAYLGHLAQAKTLDEEAHRCALIAGAAVAAFNCETFSIERLSGLTRADVDARCREIHAMTRFEALDSLP
ncbi:sugar kinase [Candidatus Sumerlaeota bacterium]|nr:sugar kinase [Candidatus Sumerlaeota bacterium]